MVEETLQGSGRTIDWQSELLAHNGDREINVLYTAQDVGHEVTALEPFRIAPMGDLVVGGTVYRFNVYLVGFRPGENWSYFPAVPELLITFGIVALEIALYVAAVKTFPILVGEPEPARV
jgi:hypothetical protein